MAALPTGGFVVETCLRCGSDLVDDLRGRPSRQLRARVKSCVPFHVNLREAAIAGDCSQFEFDQLDQFLVVNERHIN